jgi:hypothetical protein
LSVTLESSIPVELTQPTQQDAPTPRDSSTDEKVKSYILSWRNQLKQSRWERQNIWNECWQLYRGQGDWSDKDDWQTKIILPKAWASVKHATNVVKRLLSTAKEPYQVESTNPQDLITVLRASQMTDLTKWALERARFDEEFAVGLETGFMLGLGVWKLWWGLVPRTRVRVVTEQQPVPIGTPGASGGLLSPDQFDRQVPPPFGQGPYDYSRQNATLYPEQLPGEALAPQGWAGPQLPGGLPPEQSLQLVKKLIREEILEGRLFIRAVDPYNFFWLPGSKLNRWVGTIEDIEIPKWELYQLADRGVFDRKLIDSIQPMKIDESQRQSALRWSETARSSNGPNTDTGMVKLTEFFGPIYIDGKEIDRQAHVIIANDSVVLINQHNQFYHEKPPYCAFSPLTLPFRTEGVGLIEMVREIHKALSKVANLSVDTLLFRLLPLFEVNLDAYENPQDFETGMTPGKIFRRNASFAGAAGINAIEMPDISGGTTQVYAALDRSYQEGSLMPEIQQALPRYRGAQTATETEALQQNQESFMGSMAVDIEQQAVEPIIEMAVDLIFQFLDTSNDPRVASILGVGADTLAGMSKEELMEMIQGDYKIKVTGISSQLQKAEMLQNLVQVMNLIGQNPQNWLPYLNQDALLRRILEAFRPAIHDIEEIIADPATIEANKMASMQEQITPDLLRMIPQLSQLAAQVNQQQADQGLEMQRMVHEGEMQKMQMAQQQQQMIMDAQSQAAQMAMQQQELAMREKELNKPQPKAA